MTFLRGNAVPKNASSVVSKGQLNERLCFIQPVFPSLEITLYVGLKEWAFSSWKLEEGDRVELSFPDHRQWATGQIKIESWSICCIIHHLFRILLWIQLLTEAEDLWVICASILPPSFCPSFGPSQCLDSYQLNCYSTIFNYVVLKGQQQQNYLEY